MDSSFKVLFTEWANDLTISPLGIYLHKENENAGNICPSKDLDVNLHSSIKRTS